MEVLSTIFSIWKDSSFAKTKEKPISNFFFEVETFVVRLNPILEAFYGYWFKMSKFAFKLDFLHKIAVIGS